MGVERRNIAERAAVVRQVINSIVQNPSVTLSVTTLQTWLGVPMEAAQRILQRLASSGLIREVRSEEHTSELQSQSNLVCRLLLEKKKDKNTRNGLGTVITWGVRVDL